MISTVLSWIDCVRHASHYIWRLFTYEKDLVFKTTLILSHLPHVKTVSVSVKNTELLVELHKANFSILPPGEEADIVIIDSSFPSTCKSTHIIRWNSGVPHNISRLRLDYSKTFKSMLSCTHLEYWSKA